MRNIVFPIGSILQFDGTRITDHNRDAINITWDKIEYKQRMANGTLRKFVVADKRKIKVAWSDLPKNDNQTVDGFMGAVNLVEFYKNTPGEFNVTVTYGDNSVHSYAVMFESFSYKITKRSPYTDFYDIDVSLEEV